MLKDLYEKLKNYNLTISTCESASGGYLSNLLTSVDGSSDYFFGSIVSYRNEIKIDVLGIDEKIIITKGAVSSEVAELMARNANKIFKTDITVSITGNASYKNLIEEKPSCLYYVGFLIKNEMRIFKVELEPHESREKNKENISRWIIKKLNELIK